MIPNVVMMMELLSKCSGVRTLILGSFVHYVLVLGSVANTHNSNNVDIKNHTFIANVENTLHGSFYIAWFIGLTSCTRVPRQEFYIVVAPFLQATWSADVTLDLFLKLVPMSQSCSPSVAPLCSRTALSSYFLIGQVALSCSFMF